MGAASMEKLSATPLSEHRSWRARASACCAADAEVYGDAADRAVEVLVRDETALLPAVRDGARADNFWTHTMDISGYALEQHLLAHCQQSARVVHIGVIPAHPQRVDIQPREDLHELQFAPGQDGDPSKLALTYRSSACCPQSTARRRTVAPSGSWMSMASPWLRDDSNATSYDVYLGKRRQPTNKVLTLSVTSRYNSTAAL
ncbi:hypothetical protein PR001_g26640 [Phytophthora rubi]|uniref:Uncharacterized protein n=1 Tax=Phytophthora rubi TaxID=129364 RepID=A0A6A3HRN1_9STRA|nr:hypothetical protein PR001_g26640 [Phytophthora rubi]